MSVWGGWLVIVYGFAHTVGAFTVEGGAQHASSWLEGDVRGADLNDMSPAMSAFWLTIDSFGPMVVLLGFLTLWVCRQSLAPPRFVPCALLLWVALNLVVLGPGAGQDLLLVVAALLLLGGSRRGRSVARPDAALGSLHDE